MNADDPGVRARRYGLVREAAEALARRRRTSSGSPTEGERGEHDRVITKRVYDFSEGSRDMRDLLGGKGANVAEMTRLGLPVPKGFTITTEACIDYLRGDHAFPAGLDARGHRAPRRARGGRRQAARRRREPAPGLGAQRRQVLDARDDGHGPQPRPQRRERRGPRGAHRQPPLRLRLLPPLHPDVRRRGAPRSTKEHFEKALSAMKAARGVEQDVDLIGGRPPGAGAAPSRRSTASTAASPSRRSRAPSSTPRSGPCSSRGTTGAPGTTAASTASTTTSAPRSTCSRWCSATPGRTRAPASPSPAAT